MTCLTCKFFHDEVTDRKPTEGDGECRRSHPTIAAHSGASIHGPLYRAWPVVKDTDWCGEYRFEKSLLNEEPA